MQDVRFSLRVLRKSPGFAIAAVLTLALAIGANAVVFAVLNGFILRPLNVPRTESLYVLESREAKSRCGSRIPIISIYAIATAALTVWSAWNVAAAGLDTGKDASKVWCYEVRGNYFDALGIQPYLGRFFHGSDERAPNSAPYIVLGYAYWHSHFQDDRGVVGRVVQLNKHPFTILGVAPPDFQGTLLFTLPISGIRW